MPYDIIGFALAIAAVLIGVVAHIAVAISYRRLFTSSLVSNSRILACENALQRSSAAHVEATVAGLDADVAKLSKAMRSQIGQLWGTLGALEQGLRAQDTGDDGERPTRDELRSKYLRARFNAEAK